MEGPPLAGKTQEALPKEEVKEEENTVSIIFTSPHVKNGPDRLQSTGGEAEPLPGPSAEPGQIEQELEEDGDAASGSSATDHSDEEWRGSEESNTEDSDCDAEGSRRKVSRPPKAPQLHPVKKAKTRFCCKVCGKSFHATMSLVNHVEVHSVDVCGVCGKRLEDEETFRAHLRMHVKGKVCSYCGKCFGSSSSLEKHLRVHTGEKPFECSECGKSFNCHHNMVRHVRLHTGEKPYGCTVCGKSFGDYSILKRHLQVHREKEQHENNHGAEKAEALPSKPQRQPPRLVCEVCGKKFHSTASLVNHAKTHATDTCGVCGMHFESEEILRNHLRMHKSGQVCEVCGKCFDGRGNLEIHMRVHTGEKPFECNDCGKSFNCHYNMVRHVRLHTGEKPHHCSICGKAFFRKTAVRAHMKSHAADK